MNPGYSSSAKYPWLLLTAGYFVGKLSLHARYLLVVVSELPEGLSTITWFDHLVAS